MAQKREIKFDVALDTDIAFIQRWTDLSQQIF